MHVYGCGCNERDTTTKTATVAATDAEYDDGVALFISRSAKAHAQAAKTYDKGITFIVGLGGRPLARNWSSSPLKVGEVN